jgi:outer membrane protein TolC
MGRLHLYFVAVLLLANGCWQRSKFVAARVDGPTPFANAYDNTVNQPVPPADPALPPETVPPVPRILASLDGQPWQLTLNDALSIAMRNSAVVRASNGSTVAATGTTVYDPAINEAAARAALAIFDPTFQTSIFANWINQPSGELFGPGIPEQVRRNEAGVNASLVKPLLTGGKASVAYNPPLGFLYLPNGSPGFFNPLNTANIEFAATQPLLRGAGAKFTTAPIIITQIQANQSSWDLKSSVMGSVRSVMQAYWNLQAAYVGLKAIEDVLPLVEEVVRVENANFEAQRSVRADVAKAYAQLHQYREQRLAARATVIDCELQLRNLLGLEPADGRNIIPSVQPTRAPIKIDPPATMAIALSNRPDLIRQRLNVRIRELQLLIANNAMKPQLDFNALYRMNGLGSTLESAWKELVTTQFTDWQVAAVYSVPLGRRVAKAAARGATLAVEKERALLSQTIHQATYQLGDILRQLDYLQQEYIEADTRLRASEEWLQGSRIRYQNPPPGGEGQNWLLQALNDYLMALRFKADAAVDAATLLAQYNTQLARLEEATGTLLASNDIQLANDPCAQVQSVTLFPLRLRNLDPACYGLPSDWGLSSAVAPQSIPNVPPMPSAPPVPNAPVDPSPAAPEPLPPAQAPVSETPLAPTQVRLPKQTQPVLW